jgi:subtilase family serine protease
MTQRKIKLGTSLSALAIVSLSLLTSLPAKALPAHNVPKAVALANDLGRTEPTRELNLTVVLKLHNSAEYDKAVEALYDPASPTFHHWFTDADFAKYAPTAAEFDVVKQELIRQGFSVVSSDPHRFSIRVHGTVAKAESAFQTQIHSLSYKGKTFNAHTSDAQLRGAAGELVEAVAGLERHTSQPQITVSRNPRTNKPLHNKLLTKTEIDGGLLKEITGTALTAPSLFTYYTNGAWPLGVYYGTVYDVNPALTVALSPTQLQNHYGLTPLIKEGYDGTGQTVALVEAYGYAAAEADANTYSQIFGLPALTSSNFSTIYPEGKPLNPGAADLTGWTLEIALDIQTAHSIAPGAKIVVVASAGQDNEDQIASLQYIIDHKIANTASSSWENDDEIISGPAEENAFNAVLKKGAAAGVSFQFSSGDGGDLGLGTPVGDVAVPSNAPYATAVGGTSILNNPSGSGDIVAGWGNNLDYIALGGPTDPPTDYSFFYAGAGGGESAYWPKPSWQSALPGTGRQVPDVSALADPFTGVVVIYSYQGQQYAEIGVGGTSLASPLFTSIWAIADQYNGKPLGFAAPAVAKLKPGQITDVVPTSSLVATDPAGTVYDSSGATFYSADGLFYPGELYSQTVFPSAVWPFDSSDALVLSFGTDSSLTVTPGWDNVTGYGEPNGLPFIQGVTGKTKGSLGK